MTATGTTDLHAVVDSLLGKGNADPARRSGYDPELWDQLQRSGFDRVLVREPGDEEGGSFSEFGEVLTAAGANASPVPIVEASLASALVTQAGRAIPSGLIALYRTDDPLQTRGAVVFDQVPYGQHADWLTVVSPGPDGSARLHQANCDSVRVVNESTTLASEPRADLEVNVTELDELGVLPSVWQVTLQLAAARALLMVGALQRTRDLAVEYTRFREQFGGPIIRFQAVQNLVVEVVTAAEVARAMCDHMIQCIIAEETDTRRQSLAVAAARVVTGESAVTAFRAAHQIFGAIGFTKEHELHLCTTRLLSWREDDRCDRWWAQWLGREVRASGERGMWQIITGAP